jgi:flagellar operon protein (TIGR03826 family)
MEIKNCKSCGRLFNYLSGPPLCLSCTQKLEKKFEEVKDYIYDHPKVGMQEVSEIFEVPIQQIKQWIREERLSFAEDSMIGLECELCGVTIKTGRFCKACKDKLAKGFTNLYHSEKPSVNKQRDVRDNPRMRFLDPDSFKK